MRSAMRLCLLRGRIARAAAAAPVVARLSTHLGTPLYRNAYALTLSSAITSAVGVAYWVLAARSYPSSVVGLNSAAISAMMFLSGMAQLNLTSALIRFIPEAGRTTSRFVCCALLISAAVALVVCLVFLRDLGTWAHALTFLGSSPLFIGWFTAATVGWCVFVLQDSVLTGLGQAMWVPIENAAFSVIKVVLLLGFAVWFPRYGVLASWTVAMALTLLPVNILIFGRLIPRHIQGSRDQAARLVPARVVRYVAGDYVGALCWLAATTLVPVMVTVQVGATENAYFYLSWQIALAIYFVSPNMGSSLIVEVANDPPKLATYSYHVFRQTTRIVVPLATFLALCAPFVLRIFGSSYAEHGTLLLRLLALSAIPHIANSLYVSIARAQRRVGAVVAVLAPLCTLVLLLSYLLVRRFGITGVGVAWLTSQTAMAMVLVQTQLRPLWASRREHARRTADPAAAAPAGAEQARTARSAGTSAHEGRTPHEWVVGELHTMAVDLRLLPLLQRARDYPSAQRRLAAARRMVGSILPAVTAEPGTPSPTTWTIRRLIPTASDMTVLTLAPRGQPSAALLKLPRSSAGVRSLERHQRALTALHADERLGEWRQLLPRMLAAGTIAGQAYMVERIVPGRDARAVLSYPEMRLRAESAAAAAIGELHRRTAHPVSVDDALLRHWLDGQARLIGQTVARRPRAAGYAQAIDRLCAEVREACAGRTVALSTVHGDFFPGNILVTPDGARVTGIVDWDHALADGLPHLDLLLLLLSTRMLVEHRTLGDVTCALLDGAGWTAHERALLDAVGAALPGDAIAMRAMILLCWLTHVAANLTKSTWYAGHRLWVATNIERVLQCV